MKYKTAKSIFPSPDTFAEQVAEEVYYAEPNPSGGSVVTIPKTAPVIQTAFTEAIEVMRMLGDELHHTDNRAGRFSECGKTRCAVVNAAGKKYAGLAQTEEKHG